MSFGWRRHRRARSGSWFTGVGLVAVLAWPAGCSPSEHDSGDVGAESAFVTCGGSDAATAPSVDRFVKDLTHSQIHYTALKLDAMNAVMEATRALDAGSAEGAAQAAQGAGYRVYPLTIGTECYWVLQPTQQGGAEQATLIYAPGYQRNLVIEAPHVPEDHYTSVEAAALFSSLGAKAVIIAGSHRCAVTTPSGCRTSFECNARGVPVKSDPSHSTDNALHAMHLAFRSTEAVILQLHTNLHPELNGDAMVSNGTHYVIPGTPADAIYEALKAPDVDIRSCNDPNGPQNGAFCGETNTQGLASNGAADMCLGRATARGDASSHRFVHLEQSSWRTCSSESEDPRCIDDVQSWSARVAAAIARALPAER